MNVFVPIDEETNIEEYPGYIGMTWDGELSMLKDFEAFQKFNWDYYSELVQELDDFRQLSYEYKSQIFKVNFEPFQDVGYLIDELITVEAFFDDGGSYGGMASGSGYIFFIREGFNKLDVLQEIEALTEALIRDFNELSN